MFRTLYTFYGLNLSLVLLSLTVITSLLAQDNTLYNKYMLGIIFYSYFAFGPIMLILCSLSLSSYFRERLLYVCDPLKGSHGDLR